MSVKIRETSITNAHGSFTVHPDLVRADLMIIADLDGSFGDEPDPGDANFSLIHFAPANPADLTTPAGRVQDQLQRLVDSAATDVQIHGVGADFLYQDGTTIEASPGLTLPGGVATIFYDTANCDGDGRWIVGTNGNHECTPTACILHHEMGHALLSLANPFHDEADAIVQENDLRERLNLVPRDPAQQQSGCGCPDSGCCIIASVATGSPFSAEVHALRQVRDHTLRATRLGERLFAALHDEYYRFSTQACRILVCHERARRNVESWLVRPLVRVLGLALDATANPGAPERLGEELLADHRAGLFIPRGGGAEWRAAVAFLDAIAGEAAGGPRPALDGPTGEIVDLLAAHLPECPHVSWGIVEPIRLYAEARLALEEGTLAEEPAAAGERLAEGFDGWLARVPFAAWAGLPPDEIAADVAELAETVFTRPAVREALIRRLPFPVAAEAGAVS